MSDQNVTERDPAEGAAMTDQHKPLTAARIEELRQRLSEKDSNGDANVWLDEVTTPNELLSLLAMLQPPTDAEVREAVVFLRSIPDYYEHGEYMAMTEWQGMLAAHDTLLRAVQQPRMTEKMGVDTLAPWVDALTDDHRSALRAYLHPLTDEQEEAVRRAHGNCDNYYVRRSLRAAFPALFVKYQHLSDVADASGKAFHALERDNATLRARVAELEGKLTTEAYDMDDVHTNNEALREIVRTLKVELAEFRDALMCVEHGQSITTYSAGKPAWTMMPAKMATELRLGKDHAEAEGDKSAMRSFRVLRTLAEMGAQLRAEEARAEKLERVRACAQRYYDRGTEASYDALGAALAEFEVKEG